MESESEISKRKNVYINGNNNSEKPVGKEPVKNIITNTIISTMHIGTTSQAFNGKKIYLK